jgi:hypothetical protein
MPRRDRSKPPIKPKLSAKGASTAADAENPAATQRAESLSQVKQAPSTQDTVTQEAVRAQQAVIRQMRERLKACRAGEKSSLRG